MTLSAPQPPLLDSLRALPRPFWVLCAGTFINRFGTFVFPFLTIYLTKRGFATHEIQWALFAHGAGHLGAVFLGGWLADRIGRRNTIALSMFSAAAAMVALEAAQTIGAIVLFAGLTGLTIASYHPASSALLADIIPAEGRVRAYTLLRIAINSGWAAGVATGGWLATQNPSFLFWGDAFTCSVFGVLALTMLPHGLRRSKVRAPWGEAIVSALANRPFVAVFAANAFAALVFCQMSTTFAKQVTAGGFSETTFGILLAANGVLIAAFELPISNYTSRLPVRPVLALGYLLIGGGFALNIFGPHLFFLTSAMVVFTLGEMLCLPVSGAHVAGLAPAEMRGRYMGLFGLSWSSAALVAPLGLALFDLSPALLWLSSALVGVAGAVTITLWGAPEGDG